MSVKVSIITPTYNSEKYIAQTIDSVLSQTCKDFEMIIIDDCSKDTTTSIIEEYLRKDDRISLIQLDTNKGAAKARNTGIEKANGKYLTFLDGDDLWFPEFLEKSVDYCTTNKVPFVFASYKRYDENLKPLLNDFIVPHRVSYTDLLKSCAISCLTAFIDIGTLGKKYMPPTKKRQDFGLWLSYLKEIDYAYGIKEPLAIYRMRKDSLSRNKWNVVKYQWAYYYDIEKLGIFRSVYYLINWMVRGTLKYRN